jgi:hypothetical protein
MNYDAIVVGAGPAGSTAAREIAARGKSVLYTFSMQGWGKLSAALVNYALVNNLAYFGGAWELDSAWRFALALGCLLNVVTLPFRYLMEESEIFLERSGMGGGGGGGEGEAAEAAKPDAAAAAAPTTLPPDFKATRRGGIVGGSYAGAFVTWLTVRHGDLIAGTWASSGVVNAIYNFSQFDATVSAAVGDDCSDALREVMTVFEAAWEDDTKRPQMLELFNAPPDFHTQGDFAWMLADR